MYGKTLSIPDEAMGEYYRLLLDRELPADAAPREAKRELARELVSWLHSPRRPRAGRARVRSRVRRAVRAPEEIEEGGFAPSTAGSPAGRDRRAFGLSRAEARRLIDQGAVTLGEEPLASGEYDVPAQRAEGQVLRVGRRRFRRLRGAGQAK